MVGGGGGTGTARRRWWCCTFATLILDCFQINTHTHTQQYSSVSICLVRFSYSLTLSVLPNPLILICRGRFSSRLIANQVDSILIEIGRDSKCLPGVCPLYLICLLLRQSEDMKIPVARAAFICNCIWKNVERPSTNKMTWQCFKQNYRCITFITHSGLTAYWTQLWR